MKAYEKKINLLPKEYVQAELIKRVQLAVSAVVLFEIALFIILVVIPPKMEAREVMAKLDQVSAELNDSRFANVNQKIQELEQAKKEIEEWVTKYGDIKEESFVSKRVLNSLTARLPFGLTLNKVVVTPSNDSEGQIGEKKISIEGDAEDSIAVFNYATVLEGVYGLGSTSYEFGYDKERANYDYKIEVKIPEPKNVENEGAQGESTQDEGAVQQNTQGENNQQAPENTEGGNSQ